MIPVTYPSSLSYKTTRQMVAFPIADITGKRRWTDYIPVKFVNQTTFTVENSHNNNAYVAVDVLSSITNLKEGIDYIPIYIDDAATDAWQVSATGYIPVGYSGASLSLQFAGSTFLDSRITFTRASSGTYFDNTGVLRRANRNLLTYSEQFDNATWAKTRSSISANAAIAPDGLTTADKLVEDTTASNTHLVQTSLVSLTTGAQTYSIYAKAAERTRIVLGSWDGSIGIDCVFNLNTGVVDVAGSGGTASITPVGNGWYRCSVSRTIASTTLSVYYYIDSGTSGGIANSYTGNGTSGIYIWGAQLEEGSTATQYAKTVASTSGAPRFDHDPVTKAPRGLLIEEQRTNLLTYSEDFTNAVWGVTTATVTSNSLIAPDGAQTADQLVETAGTGTLPRFAWIQTISNATVYAISIYAKEVAGSPKRYLQVYANSGFTQIVGGSQGANFDLGAGTVTLTNGFTASITAVGNGWYRCTVITSASNATTAGFRIALQDSPTAGMSAAWNPSGTGSIALWGAQLEAGSFATSYIPTVAAQVTRSADSASMTGTNFSSWYRADEGTLFAEFSAATSSGSVGLDDGTNNNRVRIGHNGTSSAQYVVVTGGVTQFANNSIASSLPLNTLGKAALAFKVNDFMGALNGASVFTNTTSLVPTGINKMTLGAAQNAGTINGHIRKLAFYPARLANAQLQALTA